jgi:hypothetical protein
MSDVLAFLITCWKFIEAWWMPIAIGVPSFIGLFHALTRPRSSLAFLGNNWKLIVALAVPIGLVINHTIDNWSLVSEWLASNPTSIPSIITPFVALVAVLITSTITYLGWMVSHKSSVKLEEHRLNNSFALEQQKNDISLSNNFALEQQKLDNSFKLEQQRNDNVLKMEDRKTRRQYISDQIRYLYSPVMALCENRDGAFNQLIALHRPELRRTPPPHYYFDETERTPEQLHQWRLWRKEVFQPLLEDMQKIILQNAHLIDDAELPGYFNDLFAHISAYRAIIKHWADVIEKDETNNTNKINEQHQDEDGTYRPVVPHTASENFPDELREAISQKFDELKKEQTQLLG